MHVIKAHNVCQALPLGIEYLMESGTRQSSRNGDVLVAPGPVTTVYEKPTQRVLFASARDANPFFHLYESMWMLQGRNDSAALDHFVHDFGYRFADYGVLHGAYGHRWRNHFDEDQLDVVVGRLKEDQDDRRSVIAMWDGNHDLYEPGTETGIPKDIPCNTHIYLRANAGNLDLTVCCRSNDAIWGAHGANAVHFSILQEYLAARIGLGVGCLYQVSNNYHAYVTEIEKIQKRAGFKDLIFSLYDDRYTRITPTKLVDDPGTFVEELGSGHYDNNAFLRDTYHPMMMAFDQWKRGEWPNQALEMIQADDWREAAIEWMVRRTKG